MYWCIVHFLVSDWRTDHEEMTRSTRIHYGGVFSRWGTSNISQTMIKVINLFIFYLGFPSTTYIITAPLAASHVVGLGGQLLMPLCASCARETGVIHMDLVAMPPPVIVIVSNRAHGLFIQCWLWCCLGMQGVFLLLWGEMLISKGEWFHFLPLVPLPF